MITPQDLELLERLHTPFGKILREHLRTDHNYDMKSEDLRIEIIKQQAKRIRELMNEIDAILAERKHRDQRISSLLSANNFLENEVKELTSELTSLRSDYEELQKVNQRLTRDLVSERKRCPYV